MTSPKDHPRGCGEHEVGILFNGINEGSSPRMRGAPCRGRCRSCGHGIIPADAGSTVHPGRPDHSRGDHPRGRGEHSCSPPHTATP